MTQCDACGDRRHVYRSCRNRHCPQCQTRVKDVDFDRHVIVVREAKGSKDRVVMLPRAAS